MKLDRSDTGNLYEAKQDPDSPRSHRILRVIEKHPEKKIHNAGPVSNYEDDKKRRVVEAENNLRLFLNTHVFDVEMRGDHIDAVIGKNIATGQETRFQGHLFADCTGDGVLGFLAGAHYRVGREAKKRNGGIPRSRKSRSVGDGHIRSMGYNRRTGTKFVSRLSLGGSIQRKNLPAHNQGRLGLGNRDEPRSGERHRTDSGLRATCRLWQLGVFNKPHSDMKEEIANRRLAWVAYIGGKRERPAIAWRYNLA